MPAAISCVTIPVDDLQKAVAFYSAGLGLSPEEKDEESASFDLDGVYLVLLNRSDLGVFVEEVGLRPAAKGQSGAILSYFTESRGEVDAVLAKVKAAGATVTAAEDDEGSYSGYFTDLDGNAWEVLFDAS